MNLKLCHTSPCGILGKRENRCLIGNGICKVFSACNWINITNGALRIFCVNKRNHFCLQIFYGNSSLISSFNYVL